MNTNPNAKRVLIYGDSLPWGLISGSRSFERFPVNVRWPGLLQELLGDEFEIIEECLCARTIDTEDERPGFEGRNGYTYLLPAIDSHDPLDIIIVSLGLNEVKSIFDFTAFDVAEKLKALLAAVKNRKPNFHEVSPRIILLSPPAVDEGRASSFWGELWNGSGEKSEALASEFRQVAADLDIDFFDLSGIVTCGIDGVHLDAKGHEQIAVKLKDLVKE